VNITKAPAFYNDQLITVVKKFIVQIFSLWEPVS